MKAWIAFLAAVLCACASPAFADTRVALLIGNAQYTNGNRLNNPISDTLLMESALRSAGFSTVVVRPNLGYAAMLTELRAFAAQARAADVALVYFAGHGMEVGGKNYLLPVDAVLAHETDVNFQAVSLDVVLQTVKAPRLTLVVLDACRNNPFAARMTRAAGSRSGSVGLAPVEPDGDTLVVYAAKDGSTAADGADGNSPFARALARRLTSPGVEIGLALRQVRDDVLQATARRQQPFTYGSLGSQEFYFVPAAAPTVLATAGSLAGLSSDVRAAAESARVAEQQARTKAAEARLLQTRVQQVAAQARDAARRAERKEGGHGVLTGSGTSALDGRPVTSRYTGQVSNGKETGAAVKVWSDGFMLEGQFAEAVPSGLGITTRPDGTRVEGDFTGNVNRGPMISSYVDGDRYEGELNGLVRSGMGLLTGGTTKDYVLKAGQWSSNGQNGYGVVVWKDGRRDEGMFQNGALNGPGVRFAVNGQVLQQGVWANGVLSRASVAGN